MAGVPLNFAVPGENITANYNWTDVADGTGIANYYLSNSKDNTTSSYNIVTSTSIASEDMISIFTYTSANAGSTLALDQDFDVIFNSPRTLYGNAYFSIPIFAYKSSGGYDHYFQVKLRKVSGGTETEIGSSRTATAASTTSLVSAFTPRLLKIAIANKVNFKKGDTLRITIEAYASVTVGVSIDFRLGNDPSNRTSAALETTRAIAFIPFQIDL